MPSWRQSDRLRAAFASRDANCLHCRTMARRQIYLARHGETDWNLAGRWQGHTDVALNATGHAQAQAMAEALRVIPLAAIVSSDLARAFHTARIVGDRLGI